MPDFCFKSKGHEYVYYLLTFSGASLYSRIGVTYKHYKDEVEVINLINKIKEQINIDIPKKDINVTQAIETLEDCYYDLLDVKKDK